MIYRIQFSPKEIECYLNDYKEKSMGNQAEIDLKHEERKIEMTNERDQETARRKKERERTKDTEWKQMLNERKWGGGKKDKWSKDEWRKD
jgi:hypothetical protein